MSFPPELQRAEDALIRHRRDVARVNGGPKIGIACSGGGIRSATVCLGAFQALARNDLLRRIDYISTISGGGYFGSFLGSMYRPQNPDEQAYPESIPDVVTEDLANDQSTPVKWLRKNGRYIAPNGPADYFNIAAIYIRNWLGVQYVVGITFITLFLLLIAVRSLASWQWGAVFSLSHRSTAIGPLNLEWSPYLLLPTGAFVLFSIPLAWSFWLTQYSSNEEGLVLKQKTSDARSIGDLLRNNWVLWATLFVIVASTAVWLIGRSQQAGEPSWGYNVMAAIAILGVLTLICWSLTERAIAKRHSAPTSDEAFLQLKQSLIRNLLSDWLATSLKVVAALAAIALIDSLAQSSYAFLVSPEHSGGPTLAASSLLTVMLATVHKLAPLLQRKKGTQSSWSLWSIASAAGLVMLVLIVLTWDVAAYALAFHGRAIDWRGSTLLITLLICLVIGIVLTLLTAQTMSFLNLSSLQAFYSARLRRAYLGASNPTRTESIAPGNHSPSTLLAGPIRELSIRRDVAGDDRAWADYEPHRYGGPLHLIGVTVNHTIGKGSDIDLRDRKGYTMTIGPSGMSADVGSHALFELDRKTLVPLPCPAGVVPVFGKAGEAANAEACTLSRWMAISGAAFSTGLGANTRTGISVLLGTANVRLGYWWYGGAGCDQPASSLRSAFRTQSYLGSEFLGRFAGNAYKHWYLSDGGHSENTGAYELIRRRLPVIVLLDNGADREYAFDDFGNLVRRVRIDFGAEISPLSKTRYARWHIDKKIAVPSGLCSLRRSHIGEMGVSLAEHAIALFIVTYEETQEQSLLILAKPTLTGDEPKDVMNYAVTHPAFPQEPTSDQFFDEAQWESYRRLGQHIGEKVSVLIDGM